MKKFITVLLSTSVLLSVQAQAYMWTDVPTLIQQLDVREAYIRVSLVDEHSNGDNCTGDGAAKYLVIDSADQLLYSAVLSAFMGGKKITFDANGCTDELWTGSSTFPKAASLCLS